jgi:hypothetical protein
VIKTNQKVVAREKNYERFGQITCETFNYGCRRSGLWPRAFTTYESYDESVEILDLWVRAGVIAACSVNQLHIARSRLVGFIQLPLVIGQGLNCQKVSGGGVDICLFIVIVITHRRLSIINNGGGVETDPPGYPSASCLGGLSKQVGGGRFNPPTPRQFKHCHWRRETVFRPCTEVRPRCRHHNVVL